MWQRDIHWGIVDSGPQTPKLKLCPAPNPENRILISFPMPATAHCKSLLCIDLFKRPLASGVKKDKLRKSLDEYKIIIYTQQLFNNI
jgi:hypothetical protein